MALPTCSSTLTTEMKYRSFTYTLGWYYVIDEPIKKEKKDPIALRQVITASIISRCASRDRCHLSVNEFNGIYLWRLFHANQTVICLIHI